MTLEDILPLFIVLSENLALGPGYLVEIRGILISTVWLLSNPLVDPYAL